MTILLTGCSGFIGQQFMGDDCIRRIVTRTGNDVEGWTCSKFFIESLDDKTNWSGAFEGIDVVIHLAGLAHGRNYTKEAYEKVNVSGSLHLAREAALAGVKRFVFVSTIGVHGSNSVNTALTASSPLSPENEYTRSKLAAEVGLKKISHETEMELVIIRPTLVYGATAPGNFKLLTDLVRLMPVLPFGGIHNKRDFISVENLKDLLKCCAFHNNAKGEVFLACEGETVSIGEFTNRMAFGLGKSIFQLPIPSVLFSLLGRITGKSIMIDQLIGDLQVDNSSLRKKLGWVPPQSMHEAMSQINRELR